MSMKVLWKGSIQLESGKEKITLEVPDGFEEEMYLIKRAAKEGKELSLQVRDMSVQVAEDAFISYIRDKWEAMKREWYEKGQMDAVQGNLLTEERGEGNE